MWHCIHYISPTSCFLQMETDVCDWLKIIMKAEWYISDSNPSSQFSPFSHLEGYSDLHVCCQLDKLAPGKLKGCSWLPRTTQRKQCVGETWRQKQPIAVATNDSVFVKLTALTQHSIQTNLLRRKGPGWKNCSLLFVSLRDLQWLALFMRLSGPGHVRICADVESNLGFLLYPFIWRL